MNIKKEVIDFISIDWTNESYLYNKEQQDNIINIIEEAEIKIKILNNIDMTPINESKTNKLLMLDEQYKRLSEIVCACEDVTEIKEEERSKAVSKRLYLNLIKFFEELNKLNIILGKNVIFDTSKLKETSTNAMEHINVNMTLSLKHILEYEVGLLLIEVSTLIEIINQSI